MHEADGEHEGSPFVIWLNLFKEVLVDNCLESSGNTSLESLRWLGGGLDSHLKETKWELIMWLTSDPKSEVLMDFSVLWIKDFFHLSHEFKGQMAVIKDNPVTFVHTNINKLHSWDLLLLSHGNLTSWVFLLFLSELINRTCWVRSC